MSQLSSAARAFRASGDVGALINTITTDLEKDFAFLQAVPGIHALESWVLSFIAADLVAIGISPTLVDFIKTAISNVLNPTPTAS